MPQDATISRELGAGDGSVLLITWNLTTANPTGHAVELPDYADKTWSMDGTLGGAVCSPQGANLNADANFGAQSNAAGGAVLTLGAVNECKTQIENPRFVRPKLTTVGVGADLMVRLCARRATPMRT